MRKQIRAEIIKMTIVVIALIGLTAFAWDFVYTGIMAKMALNGSIIGVFLFGIWLCFKNTLALKNEQVAFAALVEAHEDIKREKLQAASDPYWRHYRCLEPAIVFEKPHLLGHFFEIVYDEMFRSKKLKVSVETMQGLVHGVESRLREERSVIGYMTGLLVFMGLIGAFIGLIQMVQSVGELVGSLANAGGGSGGMSKLIADLQGPLKGMSVGFSSSLFGLFGSMTLGLMNQFSSHAGTILKTEFEAWLASAAQIDEDEELDRPEVAATEAMVAAAAGFAKAQQSFDTVARLMADVAKTQAEQGRAIESTARSVAEMGRRNEEIANLVAAAGAVGPAVVGAQQEVVSATRGLEARLADGMQHLGEGISSIRRIHSDGFRKLEERQDASTRSIVAAMESSTARQVAAIENGSAGGAGDASEVARRIESGMAQGLADVARAVETSFMAYARLVEAGAQAKAAAPAPAAPVPKVAEPVALPIAVGQSAPLTEDHVDAAEMLRRLQSAIAKQYRSGDER